MKEVIIILITVWILVSIETGRHAYRNGKGPWKWGFIVGIFGIFGLIVYAISLASD